MQGLQKVFADSPLYARIVPFIVFVILTSCQGAFGEASKYWVYLLKCLVGIWLIVMIRPHVPEMRWKCSWVAIPAGLLITFLWVGLDNFYPDMGEIGEPYDKKPNAPPPKFWNPHAFFGEGSALAWFFIAVRILGSSLVVPPLEEVFYRSFLYRWLINQNFQQVSLAFFHTVSFVMTALIFGIAHNEWLAAILTAAIFQGLVIWKNRLGDAIVAHAVANFALGIYVVTKGAWKFW